jgi:hypothetical protein
MSRSRLVPRALAFLHEDNADHQQWGAVRRHALIGQHDMPADGLFSVAATGAAAAREKWEAEATVRLLGRASRVQGIKQHASRVAGRRESA